MAKETIYTIYFPDISKEELANITLKSENIAGKNIKADLSILARGKLGEIKGVVKELKENKILVDATVLKLYPSYIRRFVRRGVIKIDDSFIITTSDKKKLRIKPTFVTRKKVKGAVETALRKEERDFLAKLCTGYSKDDLFIAIINGDIQKQLSKKLKKVYPLSFCEIREIKLEKKK